MELSPEDKERILEEERRRVAEESYRQQVREQLKAPKRGTRASGRYRFALLLMSGIVAAAAGALLYSRMQARPTVSGPTAPPPPPSSEGTATRPIEAPKGPPASRDTSIESLLPTGAKIIETATVPSAPKRTLVLWMLNATRNPQAEELEWTPFLRQSINP